MILILRDPRFCLRRLSKLYIVYLYMLLRYIAFRVLVAILILTPTHTRYLTAHRANHKKKEHPSFCAQRGKQLTITAHHEI